AEIAELEVNLNDLKSVLIEQVDRSTELELENEQLKKKITKYNAKIEPMLRAATEHVAESRAERAEREKEDRIRASGSASKVEIPTDPEEEARQNALIEEAKATLAEIGAESPEATPPNSAKLKP
ncbi:MAG: hypothetical protein LBF25_01330, partial [Puniceicoccales bacterium]|nr:hypothetical protein [Puniceicoccales bacterium]